MQTPMRLCGHQNQLGGIGDVMKKPMYKKIVYKNLNPEAGLGALLCVQPTPKGYGFVSMNRKGTTAIVIYKKIGITK